MSLEKHTTKVESCFIEIHKEIKAYNFSNQDKAKKKKLQIVKRQAIQFELNYKFIKRIYNGNN